MSLVVKDPKSDKKISITLVAEQKRHSELPDPEKFLKPDLVTALAFNATDFPKLVADTNASEGIKINDGSILDASYELLKKQNTRYLDVVNGKIEFGAYPKSVRVNFGMTIDSAKLPDMGTQAEIMGVSKNIATGDLALIALGLTPPLDFTAAENATLQGDTDTKITTYTISEDAWTVNVNKLAIRKGICRTLTTDIRKAVQFNVSGKTDEEMRTYCRTFGIVFEKEKEETEIDVLALFADGSGIALGASVRIGKLYTAENKVKKKDSVQGVTDVVNSHGEAVLTTTQAGDDLFVIWECAGCEKGSVPIKIVAGEDQSITIHLVKSPSEG